MRHCSENAARAVVPVFSPAVQARLKPRTAATNFMLRGDRRSGYSTSVAGRGREVERTGREFAWAFPLSLIFMYMILAAQLESTVHPLTILLRCPIAVPFGLLSLRATGDTLNLYSALGMLVLFGVVQEERDSPSRSSSSADRCWP
jgi:multidrug efflux pump subunit AcrB